MSSISSDKSGHRTIYVCGPDRRRRPVRLGKCSLKDARIVQGYIDDLERAVNHNGTPTEKTSAWLAGIGDDLRDKLARAALVQRRESVTLGAFIDRYIEKRKGTWKPYTLARMGQSKRHALAYFGADKPLHAITEADAEDYRGWLKGTRKLAEATTRKACGDARMWFRYAIRAGLVSRNPFEAVPTNVTGNAERQRFISDADARKVMDELPDASWRLLFALARWGGLRVPSEPRALTWDCVDWDKRRLKVRSPKTEHHKGHEQRIIPLFADVEAPLREVFEQAKEGTLHVLPFLHDRTGTALRKPLEKAIRAAGLTAWPRLWHNLRASRQTELEERHPSHVVCRWLGNSESVARSHYLQVRESDFDKALRKVVRNPVRAAAAEAANGRHGDRGDDGESASIRQKTLSQSITTTYKVPVTGLEPVLHRWNRHLKTARLPIPPHGQSGG